MIVHVLAPAGYGTKSLLSEWAGTRGCAARVSLDEDDNDPARLVAVGAGQAAAEGPLAAIVNALAGRRCGLLVLDDAPLD